MRNQKSQRRLGNVLVLLLFAVFTVLILLVMLTGADLVETLTVRDETHYEQRTAAQYLATRIRQADREGMVSVRSFAGTTALVLTEELEGAVYETLLYCHEGYLRELFAEVGYEQEADFGETVLPLRGFDVTEEQGLLRLELSFDEGASETLWLGLRSREEVAS